MCMHGALDSIANYQFEHFLCHFIFFTSLLPCPARIVYRFFLHSFNFKCTGHLCLRAFGLAWPYIMSRKSHVNGMSMCCQKTRQWGCKSVSCSHNCWLIKYFLIRCHLFFHFVLFSFILKVFICGWWWKALDD